MKGFLIPGWFLLGVAIAPLTIAPFAIAQTSAPKVIATATYRCDDGKGFKAEYRDNETVRATFGSKVIELPQAESASGARYSNGSVTIFTKGDTAFVEVGDDRLFSNCVVVGAVSGLW
ncbi:MAG: MliC family protein [Leptolyngbyaceae cyanobacterium bins.349]|nr:MliC family protein [Leptolyngbyaceae cyanobacterium bins.349]